jgi:hypothetical protein
MFLAMCLQVLICCQKNILAMHSQWSLSFSHQQPPLCGCFFYSFVVPLLELEQCEVWILLQEFSSENLKWFELVQESTSFSRPWRMMWI